VQPAVAAPSFAASAAICGESEQGTPSVYAKADTSGKNPNRSATISGKMHVRYSEPCCSAGNPQIVLVMLMGWGAYGILQE
jgi:hypothetical protein